ncbi:hypothetical protein [Amycolatopsis vancoresmycina]|uniref:hypothetical protein n=1 Tax=Amycolatopsis vancoresmycina TaxID=208444 RepID=UPI0005267A77|nr:hypothetical protein [Amycolatopsis vancoresmycina]
MRSSGSAAPVEDTVRALRRLAPGASLREPPTPELRLLAAALRDCAPGSLASRHPEAVARVVRGAQLRALRRAMTGFFGTAGPEAARLVRAARFGEGAVRERLREPGLRAAALGWAEVRGYRMLAGELCGVAVTPDEEDGRAAAELTVAALLPAADAGEGGREVLLPGAEGVGGARPGAGADRLPGPGSGGAAPESAGGDRGPGPGSGGAAPEGAGGERLLGPVAGRPPTAPQRPGTGEPPGRAGGASAFLDVRSVRVGERGFRIDVHADPPVELLRDPGGLALRALWWNGLGRVADDLGYEYLLLAKDSAGTGVVRHWCHPRPAAGARVLRLESAGYRGERQLLDRASAGSCAEVLVKLELTVRLGA